MAICGRCHEQKKLAFTHGICEACVAGLREKGLVCPSCDHPFPTVVQTKYHTDGTSTIGCNKCVGAKPPTITIKREARSERQKKTLGYLVRQPVGSRNHIDNRTAAKYGRQFVERTQRIEYAESKVDRGHQREMVQEEEHHESTMVNEIVHGISGKDKPLDQVAHELKGVKFNEMKTS